MAVRGPVQQIARVQDGHAGRELEPRRGGVIFAALAYHIQIAVVGRQDGILVAAHVSPLRPLPQALGASARQAALARRQPVSSTMRGNTFFVRSDVIVMELNFNMGLSDFGLNRMYSRHTIRQLGVVHACSHLPLLSTITYLEYLSRAPTPIDFIARANHSAGQLI